MSWNKSTEPFAVHLTYSSPVVDANFIELPLTERSPVVLTILESVPLWNKDKSELAPNFKTSSLDPSELSPRVIFPPVTIGRTYRMDIDSDMRIYAYINQGTTEVKLILEQDDTTGSMMSVGRLDTNTCEILLSGHYKITT